MTLVLVHSLFDTLLQELDIILLRRITLLLLKLRLLRRDVQLPSKLDQPLVLFLQLIQLHLFGL